MHDVPQEREVIQQGWMAGCASLVAVAEWRPGSWDLGWGTVIRGGKGLCEAQEPVSTGKPLEREGHDWICVFPKVVLATEGEWARGTQLGGCAIIAQARGHRDLS